MTRSAGKRPSATSPSGRTILTARVALPFTAVFTARVAVPVTALVATTLTLALGAGQAIAGETATASVSVEIVNSVGIEPSDDGLAFSLSGQDGLMYDLVLPPKAPATDANGHTVAIDLLAVGPQVQRGRWILDGGSDVVELMPVIHPSESLATKPVDVIAPILRAAAAAAIQPTKSTASRDDELPVFIAYQ